MSHSNIAISFLKFKVVIVLSYIGKGVALTTIVICSSIVVMGILKSVLEGTCTYPMLGNNGLRKCTVMISLHDLCYFIVSTWVCYNKCPDPMIGKNTCC